MSQFTYEWLFAYLTHLGFEDSSQSEFERAFEHAELDILLAFSMLDEPATDRPVRDADATSVEFHLQQHGLLSGALVDAATRFSGI